MPNFIRDNSLTIVLFLLFAGSLAGQFLAGWNEYNDEQIAHAEAPASAVGYFATGHFWEALFENWESEFLQMSAFMVLTVYFFQKGAAESREPGKLEQADVMKPRELWDRNTPWPVRRGGIYLKIYENSLGLALFILFVASFALHAVSGAADYSEEQAAHGLPGASAGEYLETSRFWFESFQNWQSEFLSVGVMIVFSIFLRQKGSPESKPVDSPHSSTGAH